MLAILASLVFAGAGVAAVMTMVMTVRAQSGAITKLLAESRSIAKDREFLVVMTGGTRGLSPLSFARLRRVPQRAIRRPAAERVAVAERAASSQRAAA